MKTAATVTGFLSLLSSAVAYYPDPFTAAAVFANPANAAIEDQAIQANGGHFWIGKAPSSYCPSGVSGLNCTLYPGTNTVFAGGNGTLGLNVAVPGGQQAYVEASSALGYTVPHSALIPTGANTTGFTRVISQGQMGAEYLYFNGQGWAACPTTTNSTEFQIFAVAGGNYTAGAGCSTISFRNYYAGTQATTWEY